MRRGKRVLSARGIGDILAAMGKHVAFLPLSGGVAFLKDPAAKRQDSIGTLWTPSELENPFPVVSLVDHLLGRGFRPAVVHYLNVTSRGLATSFTALVEVPPESLRFDPDGGSPFVPVPEALELEAGEYEALARAFSPWLGRGPVRFCLVEDRLKGWVELGRCGPGAHYAEGYAINFLCSSTPDALDAVLSWAAERGWGARVKVPAKSGKPAKVAKALEELLEGYGLERTGEGAHTVTFRKRPEPGAAEPAMREPPPWLKRDKALLEAWKETARLAVEGLVKTPESGFIVVDRGGRELARGSYPGQPQPVLFVRTSLFLRPEKAPSIVMRAVSDVAERMELAPAIYCRLPRRGKEVFVLLDRDDMVWDPLPVFPELGERVRAVEKALEWGMPFPKAPVHFLRIRDGRLVGTLATSRIWPPSLREHMLSIERDSGVIALVWGAMGDLEFLAEAADAIRKATEPWRASWEANVKFCSPGRAADVFGRRGFGTRKSGDGIIVESREGPPEASPGTTSRAKTREVEGVEKIEA
ncbi:MAG: hypothetical protein DRJ56_04480 [Thermoprotei archaeon]|nr:MAG: hypothetical protein DRJ56_04480 [Thermoprotei archaeon]